MPRATLLIPLLMVSTTLTAQGRKEWVVDLAGGPGHDFRQISHAMPRIQDGDVIHVRPGQYDYFKLDRTSVSILGTGQVLVRGATITNLPTNREVIVRGLRFVNFPQIVPCLEITNCRGRVALDNTRCDGAPQSSPALDIQNSTQVATRSVQATGFPAVSVTQSTLLASDCDFRGADNFPAPMPLAPGIGIEATNSRVSCSRCALRGGTMTSPARALAPALRCTTATFRITGTAAHSVTAGTGVFRTSAIAGTGTAIVHPLVRLVPSGGAPPVATGIQLSRVELASLSVVGGALGGTVTADVYARAGDAVGLTVGVPGDRIPLAGLGDLWHSPTLFGVAAIGSVPSNRTIAWTFSMPGDRAFLGNRLVWQAITGTAASGYRLSNPASSVHY